MTTYTFDTPSIVWTALPNVTDAITLPLEITVADTNASFDYSYLIPGSTGNFSINSFDLRSMISEVKVGDLTLDLSRATIEIANFSGIHGTTTVLAITYQVGGEFVALMVPMAGSPLPPIHSATDGTNFILGLSGVSQIGGTFGPGQEIFISSFNPTLVTEDDVFIGTDGRDIFSGGVGTDTFYGTNGVDVLDGGGGKRDLLTFEFAGSDVDVNLGRKFAIDAGGSRDTIKKIEDVMGSNFDDTLIGSRAGNRLSGADGDDKINGKGGKDRIEGGFGDDVLIGGGGADRFIFEGGFGEDRIRDFNASTRGEKIDLSYFDEIANFRDLKKNHMINTDDGVLITVDGQSLLLDDLSKADLAGNDFIL